jgi:membrane protease YdiL (CAAX protease family)
MSEPGRRYQAGGQTTEKPEHYPGPMAALGLTFGAVFATAIVADMFANKPDFGAIGIGQVVGFGMVAILATQRIPQPHPERLGLRGFDPQFLWVLLLLLPSLFLMSEVDNIIRDLSAAQPSPEVEAEAGLMATRGFYGEMQRMIVIVGLAPVMEEWLFRGVIQQGLMGHLGRIRGVVLTAVLFALCRLVPGLPASTLLSFLLVSFTMGLMLGCVRIATGSLLAVILLHTGFNAMGWAAGFYADEFPIDGFNVPNSHTSFQVLAPAVIATGYAVRALYRSLLDAPTDPPLDPRTADA